MFDCKNLYSFTAVNGLTSEMLSTYSFFNLSKIRFLTKGFRHLASHMYVLVNTSPNSKTTASIMDRYTGYSSFCFIGRKMIVAHSKLPGKQITPLCKHLCYVTWQNERFVTVSKVLWEINYVTALIYKYKAQIRVCCILIVIQVHFALLFLSNPIWTKDVGIKSSSLKSSH